MKMENNKKEVPKILIVDDISINVEILENIIRAEGYEPLCALNVQEALDIMNETMPELILSDFTMPGMSGLEFCRLLKSNPKTKNIPFVFITVANSSEEKKAAFLAGAVDFIPKPFEPTEVVMRVNNQLSSYHIRQEMEDYNRLMHKTLSEQKRQIEKESDNVLMALTKLVEKRDSRIGKHLERVGHNCHILAQSLQLVIRYENLITDNFIETIGMAAQLHDIGNILLPDSMLIREQLTKDEKKEAIKLHTEEGYKVLEEISNDISYSRFLNMAIIIARYHHANWDGEGYPQDIKGEDIPLEARITTVVNDFDNMLHGRYDGREYSVEEALDIVNQNSGSVYDPHIVEVFNKVQKQLQKEE